MESLLTRLIEILEEENRIYKDILDISRRKTQIIVDGKVKDLDRLTRTEQQMVVTVGRLEKERQEIVQKIAGSMDIVEDEISIDLLNDRLNGEIKDRLSGVKEEIAITLDELKRVNDLNSQLVKKSLEYIDFTINLITDNSSHNTYNSNKEKDSKDGISFFDHKA